MLSFNYFIPWFRVARVKIIKVIKIYISYLRIIYEKYFYKIRIVTSICGLFQFCLGTMHRLITQQAIDQIGARYTIDTLWSLMESSGTEEVKVFQTVTLLLTNNAVAHGDTLARVRIYLHILVVSSIKQILGMIYITLYCIYLQNVVLCFRLHFTGDCTTINTAGATVRQLVSLVFERVVAEDEQRPDQEDFDQVNLEELKIPTNQATKSLGSCAAKIIYTQVSMIHVMCVLDLELQKLNTEMYYSHHLWR